MTKQKGFRLLSKSKGFTLVELLVVIAIIAILGGILMIAINPQALIQKSRDAKRLEDIGTLVKAMNLGLADSEITLTATGTCGTCTSLAGEQGVSGTGNDWVKFGIPSGKTGLGKFVPALPIDPLNTGSNVYTFASTTSGFEFNAVLEHADNQAKMTTDGGDNTGAYEAGTSLTIIN
jgi:prepilin-type N-terminal cleavage/methylation domain-containing protein